MPNFLGPSSQGYLLSVLVDAHTTKPLEDSDLATSYIPRKT